MCHLLFVFLSLGAQPTPATWEFRDEAA